MQKIGTKAYRMQKGEHSAFLHSGTNKYVPGTTTHIRVHLKNLPTTHIVFGKAYCILSPTPIRYLSTIEIINSD